MDTLGRFSAILQGRHFFLCTKSLLKWALSLKQTVGSKFFLYMVDRFSQGMQNYRDYVNLFESVSFALKLESLPNFTYLFMETNV